MSPGMLLLKSAAQSPSIIPDPLPEKPFMKPDPLPENNPVYKKLGPGPIDGGGCLYSPAAAHPEKIFEDLVRTGH